MKTSHTPGPWIIRYNGAGYPSAIDAPNACNKTPGKVGTSITRWNAITLPSSEEGQANAQLMAAAPEMLAALCACVTINAEGIVDRDNAAFRMNHITRIALAAIQQATGDAP